MHIKPQVVDTTFDVPYSKSEFLRACLIALVAENTEIINIPQSDDAISGLQIIKQYTNHQFSDNKLLINNRINQEIYEFNCGESAFLARSLVATSVLMGWQAKVFGKGTLIQRNLSDIFDFLNRNNIKFDGKSPFLPIFIHKNKTNSELSINNQHSSQILSGLLISNAFAEQKLRIFCDNLVSTGYIKLTLNMLEKFGCIYQYDKGVFEISKSPKTSNTIATSGDWSAAAFLMVAGLISGRVVIKNLSQSSYQPDKIIYDFLKSLNLKIEEKYINDEYLVIAEKSTIPPFEFDATDNPDLIPPLVALALFANGTSKIYGVERLLHKESNRKNALIQEFTKIGADIHCEGNSFVINGGKKINGGETSSHNDHRIAMALAVAALNTSGGIVLDNPACVNKSFPNFWKLFSSTKY